MKHSQKILVFCFGFLLLFCNEILAKDTMQKYRLSGIIVDEKDNPVPYTTVWVEKTSQWTLTNLQGVFSFTLPKGFYEIKASCLGYEDVLFKIQLSNNLTKQKLTLRTKSYALDNVIVTAKQQQKDITTTYEIDASAIGHTQLSSLAEIQSLLPGERTYSASLMDRSSRRITLRGKEAEEDYPSFGTAIEVDGIRLSNNANFSFHTKGIDSRIVSSENIHKVEIITGIPSVEYGDLTSGLVKVKTKRGVMPLNVNLSISPRQKLVAFSKGIALGKLGGILNVSYDYTKAISNIVSPYTSYVRNSFTLNHTKVFLNSSKPLSLRTTLSGNVGGYNSEQDPDNFLETYTKENAFNIRGGVAMSWQVQTRWLSELNFAANFNYSDNKYEKKDSFSSASGQLAFHGTEEGYFVGEPYEENKPLDPIQLLKRGRWYQTKFVDTKPLNYGLKLKLKKQFNIGRSSNNLLLGAQFSGSANKGKGVYYANRAYIPSWRAHRYDEEPNLNNLAIFTEGTFKYPFTNGQSVKLVAGVRHDYTFVQDAKYKNIAAFSPRINLEYTIFKNNKNFFLRDLKAYFGWGESVKLPSFGRLYIRPTYGQRLAFVPSSLADGTSYYAYHIKPNEIIANKSLKWQKSRKWEIGIRGKLKGASFSLAYYNNVVTNSYKTSHYYTPFTYYLTTPQQLSKVTIPHENRSYSIDKYGTVTVQDKTGLLPNEVLQKKEKRSFHAIGYADNGSPVKRQGVEWIIDFNEIKALRTKIRLDGKYYTYRSLNNKIEAKSQGDNQLMSSGQHYQYIGYYYGGAKIANGTRSKEIAANATFITHVPQIRLIVSLKIEGTFMNWEQWLSEMPNGERSFELDKRKGYIPKADRGSIYEGHNFVGMYPLYYTSFDDMQTKIPFKEKFLWAYQNDKVLFNDLTKMVVTTGYNYQFRPKNYNPYFSANIKVSKEIGKHFKLSFFANNFLNTMQKIKNKRDNSEFSLYRVRLVAPFYYGMSLKIKL